MQISIGSLFESIVYHFGNTPTSIQYLVLTLLQGFLFAGSSAFHGWGWFAIPFADMFSDLFGPTGALGIFLYLFLIGCVLGVINIICFRAASY